MGDYDDNDQPYSYDKDAARRKYGNGYSQQPPFNSFGNRNDGANKYERPDDYRPIGPKDPDAGSGSNANEMPKTEEAEETEKTAPPQRWFRLPTPDDHIRRF